MDLEPWTFGGRPARWDERRHGWFVGGWADPAREVFVTDALMLDNVIENVGKVHPAHGASPWGASCSPTMGDVVMGVLVRELGPAVGRLARLVLAWDRFRERLGRRFL